MLLLSRNINRNNKVIKQTQIVLLKGENFKVTKMASSSSSFVAPEVKDSNNSSGSKPGLMDSGLSAKQKYAERMKKLRDLHGKRNEARKLNHQEVVEEDRRNKEPKNMEARKKRAEYVLKEVSQSH